ncbi:hypothetical protein CWI38_1310p0020 [Hamiltosporidium tvaerminnensis]|uniref:Uncharacterized protein n=1 Tax=Hamiltosporidium tvaerminnensis TaxID=1176355 RepID=A0A4Q9LSX5_9MICR|nr:hypothetical protein CWI38_1310p0020 [Hamiltosporidium tvaerminnensis]
MKFNLFFHLISFLYKPIIFVFIYHSSERDIIFNVVNENDESSIAAINNELKPECLCLIKRDETNENDEKNCLERMFDRDENRQYEQYYIEFIERIGLKFDVFEKFNDTNSNIEIFICHHIRKSDFLTFYEFIITYYLPVHKMTIEKFYSILYFLEYFRIQYDNKLRNAVKNIWISLMESNEIKYLNIEKVSFHFSKQHYFSHALFKKISQEYLKLLNDGNDSEFSFFIREYKYYIFYTYKGLFTEDRKHTLVIDNKFHTGFYKRVVVDRRSRRLFFTFLNTLDIKYLHIYELKERYWKSFCFILQNLKKIIDEIVFFCGCISDDVIRSLNANLNFENLKKIVFIKSKFVTSFIFKEHLAKINEFTFYEVHNYGRYILDEIKEGDLNIAGNIIKSLKYKYQQYSLEESINKINYIPEENKDFYLKLLNENNFKGKFRIIEYFRFKNNNLEVECFYEYKGRFNNISITFYQLNGNQFFTTENTILEENIKCIEISFSEIKSDLLRDILNIKGLESLEINYSNIYIENEIFINESIKYFRFSYSNSDSFHIFYKLIGMIKGLQEIYVCKINCFTLNRSVDQIFYITELTHENTHEMIDLLNFLTANKKFAFTAENKDISDSENPKNTLKFLFHKYDLSSIKQLSIRHFFIDNLDVKAFSNLLNLKELNISRIDFQNISFSELFCESHEYKIKRMKLIQINISEKDFIFIANLKKIEKIICECCNIQKKTYGWIKFLFNSEGYITLKYNTRNDNLSNEVINFIKEKFKTKYIVIRGI